MVVITEDGFCLSCGGVHKEDPDDAYVDFRGYRFKKPFCCMCCGKEICARQFAFGRACGKCDTGACQSNNKIFKVGSAHPHPGWWDYNGNTMFQKFVEFTKATVIR